MAITKIGNRWVADVWTREGSKRKRIRKRFATKPEAIRFEAFIINQAHQEKPWNPTAVDRRSLRDLIDRWYKVHGSTLKDGQRRYDNLCALDVMMGSPLAIDVTAGMYATLRSQRLEGEDAVSKNTVNHDLAYLKAVFNKLIEIDEWRRENPLANVKKLSFEATEMCWLTSKQLRALMPELKASSNPSVYYVARICLATGCRWGEGEGLKRSQIHDGKIHFPSNKRGNARAVPYVDKDLDKLLKKTKRHGALFTPCVGAFKKALARADIELPPGQLTHVCRHTFATTQMANGCSLRTLQYLLGHKTMSETIKYAHFAPDALESVASRSPLAQI